MEIWRVIGDNDLRKKDHAIFVVFLGFQWLIMFLGKTVGAAAMHVLGL